MKTEYGKMLTYHLIVILLFDFVMFGWSVKPVFDVANNMRLVLLPGKTQTLTHFRSLLFLHF